jgi:hypothetical protein
MGDPVEVYYNLTRRVFSVRSRKSGLVTGHHRVVVFPFGATMAVQKAGRVKVIETGQKNVHAFIRGDTPELGDDAADWAEWAAGMQGAELVTYNPKKADTFTLRRTGAPIHEAHAVVMIAELDKAPQIIAVPK